MNNIDSRYTPISMWGYFGYQLLFSIPVIGFIILIVFAINHHNINVKNYDRSYFCSFILVIILLIILLSSGLFISILQQIGG